MNNLFNKVVNFKSYLNAAPFSVINSKFSRLDADVSDFFVFRLDKYETIFIAENSLALLTGKFIKCKHVFHFFDDFGNLCGVFEINSDNFHYCLNVNSDMTNGVEIGGFTHHVEYISEITNQYKSLLTDISFQHRGYSGYRKLGQSGFSYVHGNFGAMYFDTSNKIRSLARLRNRHTYTPQFTIKPGYSYDLIFSNPVNKNTCIKFLFTENKSTKILKEKCLDSHATNVFSFDNFEISNECNISWETNLPIGRCVVFECNKYYFDVFHA